jgi:hypothetical protein
MGERGVGALDFFPGVDPAEETRKIGSAFAAARRALRKRTGDYLMRSGTPEELEQRMRDADADIHQVAEAHLAGVVSDPDRKLAESVYREWRERQRKPAARDQITCPQCRGIGCTDCEWTGQIDDDKRPGGTSDYHTQSSKTAKECAQCKECHSKGKGCSCDDGCNCRCTSKKSSAKQSDAGRHEHALDPRPDGSAGLQYAAGYERPVAVYEHLTRSKPEGHGLEIGYDKPTTVPEHEATRLYRTHMQAHGQEEFDHETGQWKPKAGSMKEAVNHHSQPRGQHEDLKYKHLPNSTLPEGGGPGAGLSIKCPHCGDGPYSASRGDYFMNDDEDTVTCGNCGENMVLGREVTHWEPHTGAVEAATKVADKDANYMVIHRIVDRFHVSSPDSEVEADIRRRAKGKDVLPEKVDEYVGAALERHKQNRKMYDDVMSGNIGRGASDNGSGS